MTSLRLNPKAKPKASPLQSSGLDAGSQALMRYLGRLLPKPSAGFKPTPAATLDKQAGDYVTAHTDPYLKAISDRYAGETAAGVAGIQGSTKNYAGALEGLTPQVQKIGDTEAANLGAATSSLAGYLKGAGGAADADVAAKLQAAGVNPDAAGGTGMGAGAAGITAARGAADTLDAGTRGFNDTKFAALMPGFARQMGQQQEGSYRNEQASGLAAERGAITQQIPGMALDYRKQLADTELAKASARDKSASDRAATLTSFLGGSLDRKTQKEIATMGLGPDYTNATGYVYGPDGKPVASKDGKLVPTAGSINDANKITADATKAKKKADAAAAKATAKATADAAKQHQGALVNRAKARTAAVSSVQAWAADQGKQKFSVEQQPVVLRRDANGQPVYKGQGGLPTRNRADAVTHTVKVPQPGLTYTELYRSALAQPEVQALARQFGMKPTELAKVVAEGLAAANVHKPAPKMKTTSAPTPQQAIDPFAAHRQMTEGPLGPGLRT